LSPLQEQLCQPIAGPYLAHLIGFEYALKSPFHT
jgi:hypothetical protein